ncbi:hypothetical protein AAMO2058_000179100 [Amorphochlora amoebiformis]
MPPSRSNPMSNQSNADNQRNFQGSITASDIEAKEDNDERVSLPRETFHSTAPRNQPNRQDRSTHLNPYDTRARESKLGSETKVKTQVVPEMKLNRIILGLREMLSRFTISDGMYVELAIIVRRDYRTNGERVQAVQQKLSQ